MRECVVAYQRSDNVLVIVPRLAKRLSTSGWKDTAISIPSGSLEECSLGATVKGGELLLAELLDTFPTALLIQDGDA